MHFIVFSDAHSSISAIRKLFTRQPCADAYFFLGDGQNSLEYALQDFPGKMVISVKGNCDFACGGNTIEFFSACGHKIMITHGHLYGAKHSTNLMKKAAAENGADIVLYGHTHIAMSEYEDGMYFINPGALYPSNGENNFCVLDITEKGVLVSLAKL